MMQPCRLPGAMACVSGGPGIQGRLIFHQHCGGVLVTAKISGLPRDGFYGLHIHDGGDCGGKEYSNTGTHYDPTGASHPNHAGDLPPLLSCDGIAQMSVLTGRFRVDEIIGKTVVIHANADDLTSQPSGNSGQKIACGVIVRKKEH